MDDLRYKTKEEVLNRIENNFAYHPPAALQVERYERIRCMGGDIARALAAMCPESRELSIALTKLEEAIMWANAAIARNEISVSRRPAA